MASSTYRTQEAINIYCQTIKQHHLFLYAYNELCLKPMDLFNTKQKYEWHFFLRVCAFMLSESVILAVDLRPAVALSSGKHSRLSIRYKHRFRFGRTSLSSKMKVYIAGLRKSRLMERIYPREIEGNGTVPEMTWCPLSDQVHFFYGDKTFYQRDAEAPHVCSDVIVRFGGIWRVYSLGLQEHKMSKHSV